jgi:hypothetical protein
MTRKSRKLITLMEVARPATLRWVCTAPQSLVLAPKSALNSLPSRALLWLPIKRCRERGRRRENIVKIYIDIVRRLVKIDVS